MLLGDFEYVLDRCEYVDDLSLDGERDCVEIVVFML